MLRLDSIIADDVSRLDDVLDSLESDNDWTKRSLVLLFAKTEEFTAQIKLIEPYIEKQKKLQDSLQTAIPVCTFLASGGFSIQMFREAIVWRDGSIVPSIFNMLVMIIAMVSSLLASGLTAVMKGKNIPDKMRVAYEVIGSYRWCLSQIEQQLYRKADQRSNSQQFLQLLSHVEQEAKRKQVSELDIQPHKAEEFAKKYERLVERRASVAVPTEVVENYMDSLAETPKRVKKKKGHVAISIQTASSSVTPTEVSKGEK